MLDHLLLEVDSQSSKSPNYLNRKFKILKGSTFVFKNGSNFKFLVAVESVLVIMRDLILGGSDTTASAMEHMLLYLSANPDIQSKIQAEIYEVIGPERMPSYEDKSRWKFTIPGSLNNFSKF